MTRKQEINAIYDRLCWMMSGILQCAYDPETSWEVIGLEAVSQLVCAVNEIWHLQDANCNLMNSCWIEQWANFEKVAEIIYDGGGRVNKPMTKSNGGKS